MDLEGVMNINHDSCAILLVLVTSTCMCLYMYIGLYV